MLVLAHGYCKGMNVSVIVIVIVTVNENVNVKMWDCWFLYKVYNSKIGESDCSQVVVIFLNKKNEQ